MVVESRDRHHWSKGGREWAWLHQVCHRMIHRLFSDDELAETFSDPESLRAHPEMRKFIAWVRRKPAGYVEWPREPRGGRRR